MIGQLEQIADWHTMDDPPLTPPKGRGIPLSLWEGPGVGSFSDTHQQSALKLT